MDAYPEVDAPSFWQGDVELSYCSLDVVATSDSVQPAWELHEESVPDGLDFFAVMSVQDWSNQLSLFFYQSKGEGFVSLPEGSVTYHVSKHDCCQPSLPLGQLRYADSPVRD